jgi:5-oxoprolinase (ATP-hydrolysing)
MRRTPAPFSFLGMMRPNDMTTTGGWQFWIDRGGTFTDVIGRSSDGTLTTIKMLSDNPERYADAAIAGIKSLLGIALQDALPGARIEHVKMGTTVATNALLERKGARTLLVANTGFADLLTIGTQARPHLFDLNIRKRDTLFHATEEVSARLAADGTVLSVLEEGAVLERLTARRAEGFEACAIAFIHAWKYPEFELRVGELARQAGFRQISLSHQVSPLVGLTARANTTTLDAYLSPVLRGYIDQVTAELDRTPISFMQSNGGLTGAERFEGKDAVLSGPAGGVVGAVRTAQTAGFDRIIGFDMGGTSTDVALYAGSFERTHDAVVAGIEIRSTMMAIHTVAAGGGSILQFDGARFRVGPESAGAHPGPACYGNGGPLTVTDANVLIGKLQPDFFSSIFGPNGDLPLDRDIVRERFSALARDVEKETGKTQDPRVVAAGFLRIAVSNMAAAVKQVSLEGGHDPSSFTLQCFGGASGQHACMLADELGMKTALLHPFAGVLSAYGMGLADQTAIRQQALEITLTEDACRTIAKLADTLANAARDGLADPATGAKDGTEETKVYLRYAGTDTALSVPFGSEQSMRSGFDDLHRRRFGFSTPERALIVESISVEVIRKGAPVVAQPLARREAGQPTTLGQVEMFSGGRCHVAPVYDRAILLAGDEIAGPALIREAIGTTIVEPGWSATVLPLGELLLHRLTQKGVQLELARTESDPIRLELFNNMFKAVADQMGVVLRNTATSVNIKERLDFSCALFDAEGRLIANAPHVPSHLGAMGETVRSVIARRGGSLKPGDMIAINDPFCGGSHLPDITVIAPVFDRDGTELRFFVANRAHHADIGGTTPGSTPANSTRLDEEGVVIEDFLLRDGGIFEDEAFRDLLLNAPYPARSPDINLADIKAQIAANEAGTRGLLSMIEGHGWPVVSAFMGHVMANAEESVRRVVDRLRDGDFDYVMDDGSHLKVSITIDPKLRQATIDFTGTSAQRPGNFNAPPAVTYAAVLYAFRCLVDDEIPLNEGCFAPLRIVLPAGSFLSPRPGAAVVAGNTEVSQAICGAVLGALGAAASSQGTMNNFLFGNARHQYYETICGGAGAGSGFDGASAVHTHMTNTRITDPEVLETRFPVRLEEFSIRRDSGGTGRWVGGQGVRRRVRALEPMTATIVSSRRETGPFGLAGGSAGKVGRQWVERVDGSREILAGRAQCELGVGDVITIETPGGGGFGEADEQPDPSVQRDDNGQPWL